MWCWGMVLVQCRLMCGGMVLVRTWDCEYGGKVLKELRWWECGAGVSLEGVSVVVRYSYS
jgi:hypothetical protein